MSQTGQEMTVGWSWRVSVMMALTMIMVKKTKKYFKTIVKYFFKIC